MCLPRLKKMIGEAFTMTVSTTRQFSVKFVKIHVKRVFTHACKCQQKIRAAKSRHLSSNFL